MSKKKSLGRIGQALALGAAVAAAPATAFAGDIAECSVDDEQTVDLANVQLEVTKEGTYKILIDPTLESNLHRQTGVEPSTFDIVVDDLTSAGIIVRN